MIKKTCALILDNDSLLIIKDKDINKWRFPTFEWENEKSPAYKIHIAITKAYKYKIKDEGFSLWRKENNLLIEGRVYALNVDPSKLKVNKCIDSMWVSLNELDSVLFDECSLIIIDEIKKNIEMKYYKVDTLKEKIICKREFEYFIYFEGFCSLLKAKTEFNKAVANEKFIFQYDKKEVNLKAIDLWFKGKNGFIKDVKLDRKDLDNIKKKYHREWWIDDNINISRIKLGLELEFILNIYNKMLECEDWNIFVLHKKLDARFNKAYEDGLITLKELDKLRSKYKILKM